MRLKTGNLKRMQAQGKCCFGFAQGYQNISRRIPYEAQNFKSEADARTWGSVVLGLPKNTSS